MPSAWGHTRLLETDWRLITQESHCFSCGSVKENSMERFVYESYNLKETILSPKKESSLSFEANPRLFSENHLK